MLRTIPDASFAIVLACSPLGPSATAETFTVATYNIEHFESLFAHYRLRRSRRQGRPRPVIKEMLEEERRRTTRTTGRSPGHHATRRSTPTCSSSRKAARRPTLSTSTSGG